MSKKAIRIALLSIAIAIVAVAILLFNPQLLTNEKQILEKTVPITLPSATEVFYSEGLKGNWVGDGLRFFAYRVDYGEWDNFTRQIKLDSWDKLPMNSDCKAKLCDYGSGLTEDGARLLLNAVNAGDGYALIQNWEGIANPTGNTGYVKQNTTTCVIDEKAHRVYYFEID